ncbi:MAG: 3-deoxy-manno-octulosonate cytidylyltransferase [Rubrivivax sp.]
MMRPPGFTVLVPARLASTRLPRKPLADLAGVPMVVRVARQAALSGAQAVVVAADDLEIVRACEDHGVRALLTRIDHPSGSDRLAEACELLGLDGDDRVVNLQGDEPLMPPELLSRCAALLDEHPDCVMGTVAHPIHDATEFRNPNVVKVVLDRQARALLFSRAALPHWRDAPDALALPREPTPLRHLGLYAYRAGFLRGFPRLAPAPLERTEALEQLRVLWHGERIAVHVTAHAPGTGVDTPEDLERVRALLAG